LGKRVEVLLRKCETTIAYISHFDPRPPTPSRSCPTTSQIIINHSDAEHKAL
jgi:hypothetical protein